MYMYMYIIYNIYYVYCIHLYPCCLCLISSKAGFKNQGDSCTWVLCYLRHVGMSDLSYLSQDRQTAAGLPVFSYICIALC